MSATQHRFAFAEHTMRANRAFDAEFYEDATRDAYLSVLNAAKRIVSNRTGPDAKSHSGVRKRLSFLIRSGLRMDSSNLELLSRGHRHLLKSDYGPEVAVISREQAEDYLNRAAEFMAVAKAACA